MASDILLMSMWKCFDNDNTELVKQVNVNISGRIKRNLIFKPKSFIGTIFIESSTFEF